MNYCVQVRRATGSLDTGVRRYLQAHATDRAHARQEGDRLPQQEQEEQEEENPSQYRGRGGHGPQSPRVSGSKLLL